MHKVHHSLFIVLLIVFQGKSQTSETEAFIDDAITTRSEPPTEAETITTTLEALLQETNDEMTSIDTITVDGSTNVEPSTGTQPITTTAETLLEETNDETTFPQDLAESTSDASPAITINLPTLAFDSTTRVPETASAVPTTPKLCKENEVYSCLPWCPRTCNNLLSKIICRPVPNHIKLCRRGCTCRAGYLLEKTIVDGSTNVEPSTGTQPITTTAETLLEETNDETTFPQDLAESTSDASPTITINLPTLAFDSTTIEPETASAVPTTPKLCKENEVYSCLPWCPRTCNNLLSKIICRPVPNHIKLCRRGCTCRAGYLLEKTIVDGSTNVEPSTGTQPITTTAETLFEETNNETTFPQDLAESTSDASPAITINLPTLAFDSTTRVPETASAVPTTPKLCKENEVYSCLPWCPRTCNNLLSKIICRPVPNHIKLCRRGCTCRAGYLLEKTIGRCVEECPTKQAL